MSSSNTWLTDNGRQQAETFVADSDAFFVERAQALKLMLDIVALEPHLGQQVIGLNLAMIFLPSPQRSLCAHSTTPFSEVKTFSAATSGLPY